jgi:hypothetical protein
MNNRDNRKTLCLGLGILMLGLALQPALAGIEKVASVWAAEVPHVDGQAGDWTGIPLSRDKGTKVEYAFRNDAENLYILVEFKDPKFLSSIQNTGLTFYFSPAGEKERDRGIRFLEKTVSPDELIEFMEKSGQTLTEERKQELKTHKTYNLFDSSLVDGKGEVKGPAVGSGQSLPPVFRTGKNGSETVYEFRLPLAKPEDHPGSIGTAPGQTLRVEFEWGGMTKEMRAAMASQIGNRGAAASSSDSSFDRGYMSGESEGGRAPSASLAQMLRGPKKHSFWVDLTLASPETK